MIPPSFAYTKPASVEEAVGALKQYGGDACVLAGGQSLLVQLKTRAIAPRIVVDIGALDELGGTNRDNGTLVIGAGTTLAAIVRSAEVSRSFPLFAEVASVAGDPMIRNRATFAGALAAADPGADWPAVALALGAHIQARQSSGTRAVAAEDFFRDAFTTALDSTELVTGVALPVPAGRPIMVYRKFRHPASGYAVVGVAAVVDATADGTCQDGRVAITGAGRRPVRARAVEDGLRGQKLTAESIAVAAEDACQGLDLAADHFAGLEYRALLARTYVKRALLAVLAAVDTGQNGGRRET